MSVSYTSSPTIAEALKLKKLQVLEEIHCIAGGGSTSRLDILAYNELTKKGFVMDPTVRYEISTNQLQYNNSIKKKTKHYLRLLFKRRI